MHLYFYGEKKNSHVHTHPTWTLTAFQMEDVISIHHLLNEITTIVHLILCSVCLCDFHTELTLFRDNA